MKLIDEKGKLFGIINIIDLAMLLVLVLLAGFAGYKILGTDMDNIAGTQDEKKDIIITVECRQRVEEAAKALKVGDRLVAGTSYAPGEIYSVSYKDADYIQPDSEGKPVVSKHPYLKDITVKIKVNANPNDVVLNVGGQEPRIGLGFLVKTQKVEIGGTVLDISVQ